MRSKKLRKVIPLGQQGKPLADNISMASLEAGITAYYDGLSDAEVEEERLWGEFAGCEFAAIERSSDKP